jgi:hypothetical protein
MSKLSVWVNDSLTPSDEANLNIADLAVQRGYGIFDFFKTADGISLRAMVQLFFALYIYVYTKQKDLEKPAPRFQE